MQYSCLARQGLDGIVAASLLSVPARVGFEPTIAAITRATIEVLVALFGRFFSTDKVSQLLELSKIACIPLICVV